MATTASIASKELTLSHGKTRYLESGTGHPVILIHGASIIGGADDFRPALDKLGTSFRWIAPDVIGWPPSDTRSEPTIDAFPDMVDFLREFQDGLGIKSSHVVGVTMGGWIAGLLAYESPNRVDKLVLTGNPGFHGSANVRLSQFQVPPEEKVRDALTPMLGGMSQSEQEALVQEKLRRLNEPGYGDAFGNMMKTMSNPANRQRFNLLRRLPHLEMPVLFLIGKGDPTSEMTDKLQGLVPGSKVVVVQEAGHQIHYETPDDFAKAVVEFLAS